jgi:hypothetical protein
MWKGKGNLKYIKRQREWYSDYKCNWMFFVNNQRRNLGEASEAFALDAWIWGRKNIK